MADPVGRAGGSAGRPGRPHPPGHRRRQRHSRGDGAAGRRAAQRHGACTDHRRGGGAVARDIPRVARPLPAAGLLPAGKPRRRDPPQLRPAPARAAGGRRRHPLLRFLCHGGGPAHVPPRPQLLPPGGRGNGGLPDPVRLGRRSARRGRPRRVGAGAYLRGTCPPRQPPPRRHRRCAGSHGLRNHPQGPVRQSHRDDAAHPALADPHLHRAAVRRTAPARHAEPARTDSP